MHAEITNPKGVTSVMLKNRKRLHVVPGTFTAVEPDSFNFDYRDGSIVRNITVARSYVATVEVTK